MIVRYCAPTLPAQGRRRRVDTAVLIAVMIGCGLVVPAVARAGTVKLTRFSGDYESGASLVFTAKTGEANRVRILEHGIGRATVRDDGAPLAVGAGCVTLGTHSAQCTGDVIMGIPHASIALGDGDDRLAVRFSGSDLN